MRIEDRLERVLADKPAALADATTATHLLIHSAALLERHLEQALAPLRLELRQYLALYMLAENEELAVTPTQLSESLKATRTQVTRLLDSLEAKGLTRRAATKADRRSLALHLTPEGHALLTQAIPLMEQAHLSAWAALGGDSTRIMQQQLHTLYGHLQQEKKSDIER